MRPFRPLFILVLIALLSSALLPTYAQGDKPKAVGLRPDAPPYALHGPYWVGTREISEKTESHPTKVQLWYPALNPSGAKEVATYEFGVTGHAIQDAAPNVSGGPYPLVIFAHGLYDGRLAFTYLTEHLASWGAVVMAIDYLDNWTTGNQGIPFYRLIYTRPRDVTWQIDYAISLTASGGKLAGMIDQERIAVMGHSLGGTTALFAAGARYDSGPNNWCSAYPDLVLPPELGSGILCPTSAHPDVLRQAKEDDTALARLAGLATVPEGLWPVWADSRVDALIPLAPAAFFFGPESFKGVKAPALVIVGSKDRQIRSDLPLYLPYLSDNLGSVNKSLIVFEGAEHLVFHSSCESFPGIIERGEFAACLDPVWDMDRAHDLINHFTTAFLLDVLKGDKEAHKALLPDAVKFVGIQYKTTLK